MGIILFSMNKAGAETSLDVEIFYVVLASVSVNFNLPIHCRFFSNLCVHVCFPGHWCLKLQMNSLIKKKKPHHIRASLYEKAWLFLPAKFCVVSYLVRQNPCS